MEFSAQQIADFLQGKTEGNPDVKVSDISKIEEGVPNTLTFLANPKYAEYIYSTKASVALVNDSFIPEQDLPADLTLIRVPNAYQSFADLLGLVQQTKMSAKIGTHSSAIIADSSTIGADCYIGALATIGENVTIGNNVHIHPHAVIGDDVTIGDNCLIFSGVQIYNECVLGNHITLHSGVIIGSDGFGFAPTDTNNYKKVPQIGNVVLEDYVEIGSNTCIDRATFGSTIIKKGVKLDNLIQVAHNVEIGENTVIAAQTGIAGSTKIGKNCMIGGQVGIIGHIQIADEVKIAAQSGIGKSITKEGAIFQGSPAFEIGLYKRAYVGFRNLPSIQQKMRELEKELKNINKDG